MHRTRSGEEDSMDKDRDKKVEKTKEQKGSWEMDGCRGKKTLFPLRRQRLIIPSKTLTACNALSQCLTQILHLHSPKTYSHTLSHTQTLAPKTRYEVWIQT